MRVMAILTTLVSLIAGILTVRAASMVQGSLAQEWVEALIVPFACFALAVVSSGCTWVTERRSSTWWMVMQTIYFFMAPFIWSYAAYIAFAEPSQFADGVAYWIAVSIPCLWIGGPLAIMGALAGFHRATGKPSLTKVILFSIAVGWLPAYHLVLEPGARWLGQLARGAFTWLFA